MPCDDFSGVVDTSVAGIPVIVWHVWLARPAPLAPDIVFTPLNPLGTPRMRTKSTTTRTTEHRIELTGDELRRAIIAHIRSSKKRVPVPPRSAQFTLRAYRSMTNEELSAQEFSARESDADPLTLVTIEWEE